MYSVIFTQAARAESIEARNWYEGEAAGLGRHFRQTVDAPIERIADSPSRFPIVFKNVRRALLRRLMRPIVISCLHASRNPLRWQKRT